MPVRAGAGTVLRLVPARSGPQPPPAHRRNNFPTQLKMTIQSRYALGCQMGISSRFVKMMIYIATSVLDAASIHDITLRTRGPFV
jgi:hypothetical protein